MRGRPRALMSSSSPLEKHPPRRGPGFFPALLIGAVLGVLLTSAGLLTWFWLHRDRTPPVTTESLEMARQRWQESHVSDYDLEVQQSGQWEGIIHTKVRGGVIVEHTNNGRTPPLH